MSTSVTIKNKNGTRKVPTCTESGWIKKLETTVNGLACYVFKNEVSCECYVMIQGNVASTSAFVTNTEYQLCNIPSDCMPYMSYGAGVMQCNGVILGRVQASRNGYIGFTKNTTAIASTDWIECRFSYITT